MMHKECPAGIVIFALLTLVGGLLGIVIFLGDFLNEYTLDNLFPFLFSVFIIVIGVGLFFLKLWARYGVILSALFFIYSSVKFVIEFYSLGKRYDQIYGFFLFLPLFIYGISSIYYFTRPKVKEQFK